MDLTKLFPLLFVLCLLMACNSKDRKAEVLPAEADSVAVQTDNRPKASEMAKPVEKTTRKEVEAQPAAEEPAASGEETKPLEEKTPPASATATVGELNGHAWVDLGLSVKWATCNVGADSPEDSGDYFAWGERSTKETYTKDNSRTDGTNINNIIGHRRRDVARSLWGEGWRLPTKAEVQELVENCEVEWTMREGVNGYIVSSKFNGASIFLPAAGYRGAELYEQGESGRYWTGTSESGDPDAEFLFFYSEHFNWHRDHRYYGLTVRPVTE